MEHVSSWYNTEALFQVSWEVGLKVNTEKTKYVTMSYHQNAGRNHNLAIASKSFENVAKFRYLRMTVTNQSFIHEEITSTLHSGNV